MADLWIESIGLVAGFIGIVAWIPQIRRVWVDEKEEGISLPTFLAVTVSPTHRRSQRFVPVFSFLLLTKQTAKQANEPQKYLSRH